MKTRARVPCATAPRPFSLARGRESIIRDTTATTTTRLWRQFALCGGRDQRQLYPPIMDPTMPAKGRQHVRRNCGKVWRSSLCDIGGNQGFCERTIHTQRLIVSLITKERGVHHSTLCGLVGYVGAKSAFSLGSEKPRLTYRLKSLMRPSRLAFSKLGERKRRRMKDGGTKVVSGKWQFIAHASE